MIFLLAKVRLLSLSEAFTTASPGRGSPKILTPLNALLTPSPTFFTLLDLAFCTWKKKLLHVLHRLNSQNKATFFSDFMFRLVFSAICFKKAFN